MEIFKIIGIGLCTVVASLLLKNIKPEFSILIGISGGVLILLIISNLVGDVFYNFNQIIAQTGVSADVFKALIKVVGIGYITEFSSGICQDVGVSNIGDYISLGGRVIILVLCFPIFKSLLSLVVGLIQ